jgi:cell division protein FtsW
MPVQFKHWFQGDRFIWGIVIMMVLMSVLSVYSASGTLAYQWQGGDTSVYIIRHIRYLLIGLACILLFSRLPYKTYWYAAPLVFWGSVVLLVMTLFMGVTENDAVRRLEIFGMTFQTSDIAKITLMMFLARKLANLKEKDTETTKGVPLIFVAISLVFAFILPANFSTAALSLGAAMCLIFIGQVPTKNILLFITGCALAFSVYLMASYQLEKHGVHTSVTGRGITWVNRISNFSLFQDWGSANIHSEAEQDRKLAEDYQAEQARIAVGTGGIFGKGPGQSTQRNFLPHPYSDYIYAIIIEEYGIAGGFLVLLLYVALLFRVGLIVRMSDRSFPAFLAIGLCLIIVFQAIIHMAVGTGLAPVTGQPLPMISMGGSSIISTGVSLGIILGISRETRKRAQESEKATLAGAQESASTSEAADHSSEKVSADDLQDPTPTHPQTK